MGLSTELSNTLEATTLIAIVCACLSALYLFLRRLVQPAIARITRKTDARWDDIVFHPSVMRWVWILIVVIIATWALPMSVAHFAKLHSVVTTVMRVMLILSLTMVVIKIMKSLLEVFDSIGDDAAEPVMLEEQERGHVDNEYTSIKKSHSLKGLEQMLTVVFAGIAAILVISILVGKDPLLIFSGLGAAAAILMLVFQDSILGVVAWAQFKANDMLREGDWITVPKYNANGIVQEVTLASVKILNWDHSIISVPPFLLVREGFQNWRNMQLTNGRRVTRAVFIDMRSVRFATPDEVARWRTETWWKEPSTVNKPVNLTAFRQALEEFISKQETMVPWMRYMVRELEPTPSGLPVEVYFFTTQTDWKEFERVQSDVYDQVIAMLPKFGLRVFQHQSEPDVRLMAK